MGHFNPFEHSHGAPSNPVERKHIGDLGNVIADGQGSSSGVVVIADGSVRLFGNVHTRTPTERAAAVWVLS